MSDAMRVWWMSFADPKRPQGQQFLGVVIVDATSFAQAHMQVSVMGVNPGGECKGAGVDPTTLDPADREITSRLPRLTLLSKQQLEDLGCQVTVGDPSELVD